MFAVYHSRNFSQEDDIVVNDLDTLSMTSEMANKLPRQNTMTIGEFYAPTPQPAYEKVASDGEKINAK